MFIYVFYKFSNGTLFCSITPTERLQFSHNSTQIRRLALLFYAYFAENIQTSIKNWFHQNKFNVCISHFYILANLGNQVSKF